MAIKLTPIQCPQCGQSLSFRPGQRKIICTSCGTNILVEDDHQHIVRHIIESEPVLAYDTKRINSQQNVPDILSQMDPDQVMRKATKVWLIIVACFVIPMLLFGNTGLGGFFVLFGLPIILLSAMIIFPIAAGKKEEMIKKIEEERKRQEIERKKEREEFERREKE
ncbi:MAG: hypothetical protein IKE94_10840, partial [Aeriscardovia sp.]|nr:hypothetical protein [Aeriscardovia sp.]